jgi:hypothetical protein
MSLPPSSGVMKPKPFSSSDQRHGGEQDEAERWRVRHATSVADVAATVTAESRTQSAAIERPG